MCPTTAGFRSLSDLGCLSSGLVKTHRPCIANGSSRLDLAESFLVCITDLLAVRHCPQSARPTLSAAKHESFSRNDCFGCRCFLRESFTVFYFLATTNIVRHSKETSTSTSTVIPPPVEQERGFCQISSINEDGPRAGGALSASSEYTDEKGSPTKARFSWLTKFLVEAHLSAPNRRWEGDSSVAKNAHV